MTYTEYGFDWGPVSVERTCTLPGDRRVVTVRTEHRTLTIYVSRTGRSLRVFEGHGSRELRLERPFPLTANRKDAPGGGDG